MEEVLYIDTRKHSATHLETNYPSTHTGEPVLECQCNLLKHIVMPPLHFFKNVLPSFLSDFALIFESTNTVIYNKNQKKLLIFYLFICMYV